MSNDDKPQVIFHAALSLDDNQRSEYLDDACRDDNQRSEYLDDACRENPQLRRTVESLLLAHEEADQFMEGTLTNDYKDSPVDESSHLIGRYELRLPASVTATTSQ